MENQQNDYELRRTEKEKKRQEERTKGQKNFFQRIVQWAVVLIIIIVILGVGWYWIQRQFIPEGPDLSKIFEIQGREHIATGTTHAAYNSNPPSSGWHYATPAKEGFYNISESIADEQAIHNLEHGHVWIAYHPRIGQAVIDQLKSFDANHIIISPRAFNETDIALVAWGRVDAFNLGGGKLDTVRIENFIKRYINLGPERIMQSDHR